MGLGEAAGNSQLCSFPLECSAAELIVSKALQWIQKPFALLIGRENGKVNATAFSPHSFFLSFLPAAFVFLKWGLESGGSFPLVSAMSWACLSLVKTTLLLSLLRLPSRKKKR